MMDACRWVKFPKTGRVNEKGIFSRLHISVTGLVHAKHSADLGAGRRPELKSDVFLRELF